MTIISTYCDKYNIQSLWTLAIRELTKLLSCNWNGYSFFSRMVCESLINSDTLEWERTQLWALTFKLVRKIIGGVDYKVLFFLIIKSNRCQILIFQGLLISQKRNEVEAFIKSVSFLLYFLKEFKIAQCFPQLSAPLPTVLKVQVAGKLL